MAKNKTWIWILVILIFLIVFLKGCPDERKPEICSGCQESIEECQSNDDCNIQTEECDLDSQSPTYKQCIPWEPV